MTHRLEPLEAKIMLEILTQLSERLNVLSSVHHYRDSAKPQVTSHDTIQATVDKKVSKDEFRVFIDCRDIEASLHIIQREINNKKTFHSLEEVIRRFEDSRTVQQKHEKNIENKKAEIERLKETLPMIIKDSQKQEDHLHTEKQRFRKNLRKDEGAADAELKYVKKITRHKIEEKKKYYDFLVEKTMEEIASQSRKIQEEKQTYKHIVSFWLLMYKEYCERLDSLKKEIFDDIKFKERDLALLKKYMALNIKKIDMVQEQIKMREEVIEKFRQEKQIEQEKYEEAQKLYRSSVKIQAWWKGIMVRQHLGPYKIKKEKHSKKGKGKGKKGKKGKK